MAFRFYSVMFALGTSLLGLVTPPNLHFVNAQVQMNKDSKAEVDRLLDLCRKDLMTQKFQEALQSCQQAATNFKAISDQTGEWKAILNLGIAFKELGKYDKAINYYQKSLAITQEIKDRQGEGKVLTNLGIAYHSLNQYDKAIDYELKALAIAREFKDRQSEGAVIGNLGIAYYSLGQYDKVIEYQLQLLAIARELKNRLIEGTALGSLGMAYYSLGQYDKAINYATQWLEIARELQDRQSEDAALKILNLAYKALGQSNSTGNQRSVNSNSTLSNTQAQVGIERKAEADKLEQLAIRQYQKGEIKESLAKLEQVLAMRQQIKDRTGEGVTLNNIGLMYASLGQYKKALEYYQNALRIFQDLGDTAGEGITINNIAATYGDLGKYREALEYYQKAFLLIRATNDSASKAATLNNIGLIYRKLGQYREALNYYQQALVIIKAVRDQVGEATTLNNIGAVYRNFGQYPKALEYYQQALVISQSMGNRAGEATTLSNMGTTYNNLGRYREALDYYQKSLRIFQALGDAAGEGAIHNNIATIYDNLGQYPEALKYYEQALKIQKMTGSRSGQIIILDNIGTIYHKQGQYLEALQNYSQALDIELEIGDLSGQGRTLSNIGAAYDKRGKYPKALEYYQQALKITQSVGNRAGEGKILSSIGLVYDNLGQYREALEYYQQALAINKEVKDLSGEGITLSNIGYTLNAQSQTEIAILFFKESVKVRESIRKDISTLSKEQQQSYRNTIVESYRSLADLLLQKDRVMEALQALDLLKVQDLQDFLKDVKGNERTALGVEMLPQEQKFLDEYNTIQDPAVKLGSDSTKTIITQLQQTAAKQNTNLNAYKDLSVRVQRLGQGTALFYPLILDNRIELVLFIPNQPPIHRSINIKQTALEAEIKAFRQQLEAQSPNIETTANELYKKLIAPIEPDLKAAKIQTIVYAPDGQMRYVPLAALHDGKQWLVERYLINNVTAVSLTNLDPNPNQQSQVLAGAFEKGKYSFTVNDKSYSFAGLPFAGKEVTDLAQTIPNTVKLVDTEFSRAKVLPNMKTSNIIHLATHAAFVEGSPDNSFILLGNGDRINLREVSEWDLPNVTLVVLSACQTALGGNLGNGIEILGFGYQLQRAKVRAAIASLWAVSDGGTQQLMSAFYTAIKTGKVSHAEALRQAQVALITGNYEALGEPRGEFVSVEPRLRSKPSSAPTKLTHPYYWAPFIMIGNGL